MLLRLLGVLPTRFCHFLYRHAIWEKEKGKGNGNGWVCLASSDRSNFIAHRMVALLLNIPKLRAERYTNTQLRNQTQRYLQRIHWKDCVLLPVQESRSHVSLTNVTGDTLRIFDDWLLPLNSLLYQCGKDAEIAVQPLQLNAFGYGQGSLEPAAGQ